MAKTPEPVEGLKQHIDANKMAEALLAFSNAAAQAERVDFGGAISAIKDATRALTRTARRAEDLSGEYERVEVDQSRGPRLEFTGRLLAETEHLSRGHESLKISLEVWETKAGALVAVTYSDPTNGRGRQFVDAAVVERQDDAQAMRFAVMDHFQWDLSARSMATKKLGWSLREEIE